MSLEDQISRLPEQPFWALRLDCSTAALQTPQEVLSIQKLVELKILDFKDRTRTGISISDSFVVICVEYVNLQLTNGPIDLRGFTYIALLEHVGP